VKKYLILRRLESTIDIIFRLPDPGNTAFAVSEPLLKVIPKLSEKNWLRGLLVDLGSKREPRLFANHGQCNRIFVVGAIERLVRVSQQLKNVNQ